MYMLAMSIIELNPIMEDMFKSEYLSLKTTLKTNNAVSKPKNIHKGAQ